MLSFNNRQFKVHNTVSIYDSTDLMTLFKNKDVLQSLGLDLDVVSSQAITNTTLRTPSVALKIKGYDRKLQISYSLSNDDYSVVILNRKHNQIKEVKNIPFHHILAVCQNLLAKYGQFYS